MKNALIVIALFGAAAAVYAGSTGTAQLQTITGSGAGTAFGDYVSDTTALNLPYRYFIEVPPNLARLNVDIFDPDIGLGAAAEAAAGRDRDRNGFDTTATYSLIGPDGVARPTLFTTGNATTPAASDNAWTAFFSSTGDTVRDNFTAAAYTNNDGTLNWSTNWTETNDDNNAGTGLILVTAGQLRIRDDGNATNSAVTRQANLSAWTTATLSFDFSTQNVEAADQVAVQVSNNGGGSWTTLETFTGAFAASTRSYNISAYIAANTAVRFLSVGAGYTGTDSFLVDNVQIKDSVIRPGHWEVRVDESDASTTGDDINAFGLRANDGDATAAGTELPIYADSFLALGINPPNAGTSSRAYTFYPYVTSGCACAHNDFDFDSNSGNVGSMLYTSRSGAFSTTFATAALSTNDVWVRDNITGWTSDSLSQDYGLWQLNATINSYLVAGTPNGNYTALWDSNFSAAANPPTANPQANAFRIYLANDGGTAPVKPYLEQQLTQRGNTVPAVGSPTRYTVTVRMTNPTAQAITFSATHLVTTNVPGGAAVYGGNAQVGQGAIVAQPAVGGSGNITWNPGTLAAGAVSILSYDVTVTPASAGQRVPVTATPASGNGSRATYVDETGNTTQARALFTFGPLCELAMTQGLLTESLLSSFDVSVRGGATLITWNTSSEAGTVGFNLYRFDGPSGTLTPVNSSLLIANPGAPQGGRYRFVDSANTAAAPSYVLEEITAKGTALRYGPFAATLTTDGEPLPQRQFEREARGPAKAEAATSARLAVSSLSVPPAVATTAAKGTIDAVMIGVRQTGLVRVASSELASTLGMQQQAVEASIKSGRIDITDRGSDIAWIPAPDNSAVYFFGDGPDTSYARDRVYRLSLAKGVMMSFVNATPAPPQATSFNATADAEVDSFAATILPVDPDSDYWFWDFVVSGDATDGKKSFAIDVPAVASTNNATLQVRLQGAIANQAHHARVTLNGTSLGDVSLNSLDSKPVDLAIPAGLLLDGANTVVVEGVLDPNVPYDVFYIDGFAIRYSRAARASGGRLAMPAKPGSVVTATLNSGAFALDVTRRQQPALLIGGGTSFVVPPGVQSLFFSDLSGIAAPSLLRGSTVASLADRKNRADYVVIAPAAVRSGADALAQLRERAGLTTFVANLNDIYDEFSGGNPTPYAIRDFLSATRGWSKAPRYVVLAGGGSLDYRGLTVSPGLLPPLMARTSNGLFAADSRFVDFDGDGLPDLALGRIPVATNAELLAYVAKLDASARTGNGNVVFGADAQDRGADFKRASAIAEAPLAGLPATRVYVDDAGAEAARSSLLASWRGGTPFVSWMGHGGVDRISNLSLLTSADASSLGSTTGQLPLFVAMTCSINRFELGDVDSLGAALTRASGAGALAVWSASGLSVYSDATQLEQTFTALAAKTPNSRIGDLIVQSLQANRSIGETGKVYLLLGDPAIQLTLPAATTPQGKAPKGRE
ncbi:MAG: hypothetical protein JWN02_799 [Acidobacteria bacterium]|nr:hypothetical protein [Acidobacteriota bacterium]